MCKEQERALWDRAEQRLRMCLDGRGLGSNLVSFLKGFFKTSSLFGDY